jgi:hypothetical protein
VRIRAASLTPSHANTELPDGVQLTTNDVGVSGPLGLPDDMDAADDSFVSASALVNPMTVSAPTTKVKIRAKDAALRNCRCDANFFCKQSRGAGDVFATVSGHCIVVHPSAAQQAQVAAASP